MIKLKTLNESQAMFRFSQEFLEKTIRVWQPHSAALLSLENAREITENMTGLFSLLLEWERKYAKKEKRPLSKPD